MAMNAEYLRQIQAAEKEGNARGAAFLKAQREAHKVAVEAGIVKDIPPVTSKVEKDSEPASPLRQQLQEYKSQPHTPELVTATWQTVWQSWGERVDLKLPVPSLDRTPEELVELEKNGNMLVFVPDRLASQEGRHLLGEIFPEMRSYSVEKGNPVTNEHNRGGWYDIEKSLDVPHTNTTEKEAKKIFDKQERNGQRLNTYIIGSQFSKLTAGHYFDESTYSRMPGSRREGRVVGALFNPSGDLSVRPYWDPRFRGRSLGARSEGVKKA